MFITSFFFFVLIFLTIGEIQQLQELNRKNEVRIVELEKVRDGHNISAMLSICKPETRRSVSELIDRASYDIGHSFNVDSIGLRTKRFDLFSYSQLTRFKSIAAPILKDLLSMFKVSNVCSSCVPPLPSWLT